MPPSRLHREADENAVAPWCELVTRSSEESLWLSSWPVSLDRRVLEWRRKWGEAQNPGGADGDESVSVAPVGSTHHVPFPGLFVFLKRNKTPGRHRTKKPSSSIVSHARQELLVFTIGRCDCLGAVLTSVGHRGTVLLSPAHSTPHVSGLLPVPQELWDSLRQHGLVNVKHQAP